MLTLRKLTSEDLNDFWKWGSDSSVTKSLFWDAYTDKQVAFEFMKTVVDPHPWFKAICRNGVPVGAITLDRGKFRAQVRAELGYVLAKDYWGQGIATKAVQIALNSGFSDLSVTRIEAFVDPENLGSSRVLEKAGFEKEAVLKNYVQHRGITRDRIIYASFRI